eukprot:SAG11_NODE_20838_length_437_cov_0.819527_1_plen_129_part_10
MQDTLEGELCSPPPAGWRHKDQRLEKRRLKRREQGRAAAIRLLDQPVRPARSRSRRRGADGRRWWRLRAQGPVVSLVDDIADVRHRGPPPSALRPPPSAPARLTAADPPPPQMRGSFRQLNQDVITDRV